VRSSEFFIEYIVQFISYSSKDVRNALQNAYTGKAMDTSLSYLVRLFNDQPNTKKIVSDLVNIKPKNDVYHCDQLHFGSSQFAITQAGSSSISIRNNHTKETVPLIGIHFPDLQKRIVELYIQEQLALGNAPVDLRDFDLSEMDLSHVDFRQTVLSKKNFEDILAGRGDVKGATLASTEDISNWNLTDIPWDKDIADFLIRAGVDSKYVLINYFNAPPGIFSHIYKTNMLNAYLDLERKKGNVPIDISQFNLNNINRKDVNFDQVKLDNDQKQANPEKIDDGNHAIALQNAQSALSVGENDTYDTLPPALKRLQPHHWDQLGGEVLQKIKRGIQPNFLFIMNVTFYQDIYEKASTHIDYVPTLTKYVRQRKWNALVNNVINKPESRPHQINFGRWGIQADFNTPEDPQLAKVYLLYHENYNEAAIKSRLQFVVTSAAGPALYLDIAKVMDKYISEVCNGLPQQCPVQFFKVYSEDEQIDRSDSAVFYLNVPLSDPHVAKFAEYLNNALGNRLAPLEIIGATSIGDSYIQGITIPKSSLQKKVIGEATGSLGELVQNVLIRAYQKAVEYVLRHNENLNEIDLTKLNEAAQIYATEIWKKLGL
jgi:uncharacterized protein YjbI with pentapeptide repeats